MRAMAARITSLPALFPSILNLKPPNLSPVSSGSSSLPFSPPLTLSTLSPPPSFAKKVIFFQHPPKKKPKFSKANATPGESQSLPSDSAPVEIVSASGDDASSAIIQVLLFAAFIGLCVLTVGVTYLAVTDFLQKRENEKVEKENAASMKKKQGGKKVRKRARAEPRAFGRKIK
ncbi:hypothetical protein Dimus_009166 [Dionaea muscipula]